MIEVKIIKEDKKKYIELLLLADESEDMIDKYLEDGEMFGIYDGELKGICVVLKTSEDVYEIKNISVYEEHQGNGYGKALINYVLEYYKNSCKTMLVGTGDCDSIISFYEKCGFELSHRIKDFFIDNYNHPMFENGKQLIDMVYLRKDF